MGQAVHRRLSLLRALSEYSSGAYPIGLSEPLAEDLDPPRTVTRRSLTIARAQQLAGFNFCTVGAAAIVGDSLTQPSRETWGHVQDTTEAVRKIEALELFVDKDEEIYLVTGDIVNHYPEAPRMNCRRHAFIKWLKAVGRQLAEFLAALEKLVSDNVYFTDDVGDLWRMTDGYGIGIRYGREITDVEFAARETRMRQKAAARKIKMPALYLRQVDDIFAVYKGQRRELDEWMALCNEMDPNRKLDWTVSRQEVNWLDLTVYTGGLMSKGKLNTKLYQKPTDRGLYLPRSSFHPQGTFTAILRGEAQRILRVSNTKVDWMEAVNAKVQQFTARGYSMQEVAEHFRDAYGFEDRPSVLQPKDKSGGQRVLALKLPYTPRAIQLGSQSALQELHSTAMQDPEMVQYQQGTRFVTALLKTAAIKDVVKQW